MIPHTPDAVGGLLNQLRNAFTMGAVVANSATSPPK